MATAPTPTHTPGQGPSGAKTREQEELRRSRRQFVIILIGVTVLFGLCVWLASMSGATTENPFWDIPQVF